jgi:hypothetical protein
MWQQDTNTTEQLAKGFAASGSRFAKTFLSKIQSGVNDGVALDEKGQAEVCAAVWAAITATFAASHYSKEQQAELLPAIWKFMAPFWAKHGPGMTDGMHSIADQARRYLPVDPANDVHQVSTHIVAGLLDALYVANGAGSTAGRQLRAKLSSHMLADLGRLDALNGRNTSAGLTNAPSRIRLSQANALRSLPRP